MKEQITRFLIRLIPFTTVLFLIQFFLTRFLLDGEELFYPVYVIYLFHFISTFLIYLLLLFVYYNFQDKTGFAFMGASLIKMMAAVVFLLPVLLNNTGYAFTNLLSFFVPYFLFLIFETYYAVRLINVK